MTEHTQYEELVRAEVKLGLVWQLVTEVGAIDAAAATVKTSMLEQHVAATQIKIERAKAALRDKLEQHSTL